VARLPLLGCGRLEALLRVRECLQLHRQLNQQPRVCCGWLFVAATNSATVAAAAAGVKQLVGVSEAEHARRAAAGDVKHRAQQPVAVGATAMRLQQLVPR
jgi:hypothetical protein